MQIQNRRCRLQRGFEIGAVGYSAGRLQRGFKIAALGYSEAHTIVLLYFLENI